MANATFVERFALMLSKTEVRCKELEIARLVEESLFAIGAILDTGHSEGLEIQVLNGKTVFTGVVKYQIYNTPYVATVWQYEDKLTVTFDQNDNCSSIGYSLGPSILDGFEYSVIQRFVAVFENGFVTVTNPCNKIDLTYRIGYSPLTFTLS